MYRGGLCLCSFYSFGKCGVYGQRTGKATHYSGQYSGIRIYQENLFEEYKPVHKGDTLLVIEDTEFRLRLAQAEADLANALSGQEVTTAGIITTQNNLSVNDASIEEERVQMENAGRELERYKRMYEKKQ